MTKFEDLVTNPYADRQYLIITEPYDPETEEISSYYFSDSGFVSEPDDDPPNIYFEPRVISALNFERRLFSGGRIGGRSIPGFGSVLLNNADGALDTLSGLAFDARRVRVLLGGKDFELTDFGTIFDGTAEQIEFDDHSVKLRLRDLQYRFDTQIQETLYAGTGGLEGGDALKGKVKPLVYGEVRHIEPVSVDPANLIYQVHDGAIEAVDDVFDQGVSLIEVTGVPQAGEYVVDASSGTFTLGASPNGLITAHVQGDKSDGVYVNSVSEILKRIAVDRSGLSDPDDIDMDSFGQLEIDASAAVGIYISEERNVIEVMDDLVESIGAHFGFNRIGELTVGWFEEPEDTPTEKFSEVEIIDIERLATDIPIWRQRIGYQKYWQVISDANVAGSVSGTDRADLAEAFRVEVSEDSEIKAIHLLASDDLRETLLCKKSDAASEASRLLNLYSQDRDFFSVTVKTQPFKLELGQSVTLSYPRYGLQSGRSFRIVGMVENSALNEVKLELWG